MKIVLDTNVLLSGLMYPDSTPGRVVLAWRESRYDLVLSLARLTEIARVLTYPKIQKILRWDTKQIEGFLKQLYLRAQVIDTNGITAHVPRDPDDNPILAALIGSKADYLVTGDEDLLALADQYAILTPAEFGKKLS
jgi:putative PIN family toxin of toxin-antitoxin system